VYSQESCVNTLKITTISKVEEPVRVIQLGTASSAVFLLDAQDIQLEPGTVGSGVAGIVRVYHNNQWGTVCDGGWDMNDAKVACRQLGFTKAVGYWYNGRGSGKVWLNSMACKGTETSLDSCSHGGWGNHGSSCNSHNYDVGVFCF